MSDIRLIVPDMAEPLSRYDVTITVDRGRRQLFSMSPAVPQGENCGPGPELMRPPPGLEFHLSSRVNGADPNAPVPSVTETGVFDYR